jgi:hypothetical protein
VITRRLWNSKAEWSFNSSEPMNDLFRALGWLLLGLLCAGAMVSIALAGSIASA